MPLSADVEQEEDGRWIAEVMEVPGALAYGTTRAEAIRKAETLAMRAVADLLECGDKSSQLR